MKLFAATIPFMIGARVLRAQSAPVLPPIRSLGAPIATAAVPIGRLGGVQPLRNGNVIVSDALRKRVFMLDSTLDTPRAILGDSGVVQQPYGMGAKLLIAATSDTTLILDAGSLSILVVTPEGMIARTQALVGGQAAVTAMTHTLAGVPGGGRSVVGITRSGDALLYAGFSSAVHYVTTTKTRDTIPVLRAGLRSRELDTVARFTIPLPEKGTPGVAPAGCRMTELSLRIENPLPLYDDWAVTADGTIAIIRGRDYSIEWVTPDGAHTAPVKIAHSWEILSDPRKAEIVSAFQRQLDAHPVTGSCIGPAGNSIPFTPQPEHAAEASALPDYMPAFSPGTRTDMDGNVWIRAIPAGALTAMQVDVASDAAVFDVVNRRGILTDRVRIPAGTDLVGFGPGVAYLTSRLTNGVQLVRYRIR